MSHGTRPFLEAGQGQRGTLPWSLGQEHTPTAPTSPELREPRPAGLPCGASRWYIGAVLSH